MPIVGVLTDSCASIPEALIEELRIEVVPYYIHRGMETLRDLVDIKREEFFRWLPTARELPKTANPGPGDYLEAFKELAQRTREIVSIHMTSIGRGRKAAGRSGAASDLRGDTGSGAVPRPGCAHWPWHGRGVLFSGGLR